MSEEDVETAKTDLFDYICAECIYADVCEKAKTECKAFEALARIWKSIRDIVWVVKEGKE